ncbi:MAG: DUF3316 domain-containing protein [Paludibacter sp.]
MKKISLIIFYYTLFYVCVFAQQPTDKKYSLITSTNNTALTILSLTDPYLSPITYSGLGVGFEHAERKYFKPENTDFSMQHKLNSLVGIALNPSFSASTTYLGGAYSWGAFYHYRKLSDVQILAGATTDAQFGFKSNTRNVNNPINVDVALNLNLAAAFRYDFVLKNKKMRLAYELESPLMGCMFVPMVGASYYEMFDLWNLRNTIHFSSLHNKLAYKSALVLEVPMRSSVFTVGFSTHSLKYGANDLVFKQNSFSLLLGYKINLYKFKGSDNVAPANFISTEK